jgi:pullulanase/glycogen debranching enzyme
MDSLTHHHCARGNPWPLGATGMAMASILRSFRPMQQAMDLCLFDETWGTETGRACYRPHQRCVAWLFAAGRRAWRTACAPTAPGGLTKGHRFNPHKLLLDPYARELVGNFVWRDEHFGAHRSPPAGMDTRDNAAFALKARVVAKPMTGEATNHHTVRLPTRCCTNCTSRASRNSTACCARRLRGTYAGLAHEASIPYLKP